ncbi:MULTISPECIES: flagellar hook protein FlgE [unclassified Sphingomonas]|jgi:flagellar hook protein FlgE|uniref:flagellar hook protein FlgE n=1 Tax=unclassified Sphingomonas TaxID=196159 RepID=UPI00082986F1|nr:MULTISPECIES: flagellar hook protein FlgE [unclassified Sphingomonas]MCH4894159.1 flagellar hook-basal body complex protein [Sphingomonas sp. SFZ2018-12]
MSFFTSLSGLQASQKDMSVISHNLANVQTNGFKKSRVEFADVISSSVSLSPTAQVGSGVVTKAIRQQFTQGNLVQQTGALNLAISGDGFFAMKPDPDGEKVNFTRNGAFLVDKDRYVVDGKGANLQVYPVDGSGAVVASGLDSTISLRLPATSGTPVATSNVGLSVTLNAGSSIPSGTFDRFDPSTYNQATQTTIYDVTGNPRTLTTYFVRETAPTAGNPNSDWSIYNFVGDQQLGTAPIAATFDGTGALVSPTTPTAFPPFTPAGSAGEQTVSFDLTGSTQEASPFTVNSRLQDGVAVGKLESVSVDSEGIVTAAFSNGDTQALGKVAIINFANPAGLRQLGDSYWASTGLSGEAIAGEAGRDGAGNLMSNIIEGSNVDITEELVSLIAAQRNFQANSKALETSNEISQTIFNI